MDAPVRRKMAAKEIERGSDEEQAGGGRRSGGACRAGWRPAACGGAEGMSRAIALEESEPKLCRKT